MNGFKLGGIWDTIFHFGSDFYIYPSVSYAWSFKPEVNPVQVSLYKHSSFKDSDYENLSAFFHSSDSYITSFEDLDSGNFVSNDIYSPFFKSRYKAKSIGTASFGLKKAYNISLESWESRFIPLARVRWFILESLLGYNSKTDSLNNIVSFGDSMPDQEVSTELVEKVVEFSEKEEEKKQDKTERYTQWLEWSLGFESEFVVIGQNRLILGFALGIRTPLKFWASEESDDSQSDSSNSHWVSKELDDLQNKQLEQSLNSAFTNIYLKMPL